MSERTARRLTRILSMLPWVISHPEATVDEVCERFGYTRRELLADLDLVFVCGLPGYGPGDLMVAYTEGDRVVVEMADYFAAAPRLSPSEALALLAAAMSVQAAGDAPDALVSATEKLTRALLPGAESVLAVDIDPEPELVTRLRRAARDGKVVEITYTSLSREETTTRQVEPWSVFVDLGNWYLSAFCRMAGAERVFRIDRIRSLRETDETFQPPAEPPPPRVRYTPSEDDVRAVITLHPPARWVVDYYPVEVLSDDGDRLRIVFSAADPMVAARLLLRLGPHAVLEEGEEVAAALSDLRNRLLARYRA
ncbi:MAG: protein pafC [Acidimicrobiia bacterium]|nr:MAG: protein pafC [Acidimicrobiia bacterium]